MASKLTGGDVPIFTNEIYSINSELPKAYSQPINTQHPFYPANTITVEDVEKTLMSIKVTNAPGPDGIQNWVLTDFAGSLAKPVAAIFNSSFMPLSHLARIKALILKCGKVQMSSLCAKT